MKDNKEKHTHRCACCGLLWEILGPCDVTVDHCPDCGHSSFGEIKP